MRMPNKPVQELVVAVAGPLVNLLMSILIAVGLVVAIGLNPFDLGSIFDNHIQSLDTPANFFIAIWQTNLMLAIFNMLPAFPMDGGRVLRAVLSFSFSRSQATRWATYLSSLLAIAGLWYAFTQMSWVSGLISLFILFQARSENYQVQLDSLLDLGSVDDVVEQPMERLTSQHTAAAAFKQLVKTKHGGIVVFDTADSNIPVGYLATAHITQQLKQPNGPLQPLGQLDMRPVATIQPHANLALARHLMMDTGCDVLVVYDNDRFVGLIDRDRVYGYAEMLKTL
jgi:CBS domain-containing protein